MIKKPNVIINGIVDVAYDLKYRGGKSSLDVFPSATGRLRVAVEVDPSLIQEQAAVYVYIVRTGVPNNKIPVSGVTLDQSNLVFTVALTSPSDFITMEFV